MKPSNVLFLCSGNSARINLLLALPAENRGRASVAKRLAEIGRRPREAQRR